MSKNKLFLSIIFLCIPLLLIFSLFSSTGNIQEKFRLMYSVAMNNWKDDWDMSINLGFNTFECELAKMQEKKLINEYDLTAILLHWKRFDGLQRTLQYLLKTNHFKEIIIWNNNPQINLTLNQLINRNQSDTFVRIINSPENLKDEAKYRACTAAKTRACFYVDDDYNVEYYLKCLLASFRSDPNLLHSVTEPYTFYTNLVWTYFDSTIDLHSGFSWIGCGSVFLREHAQKHLQLIEKYLQNYTDLTRLSDVFFSVWLNDIPVQMNTELHLQPSKPSKRVVPFSSTANFNLYQYNSSVLAITILEHSLRYDQSTEDNITFSRQRYRRFPSYIKSPSFKDDFIFYTNVLPYNFENVSFNISQDFERGTRKNLPHSSDVDHFQINGTLKAVDRNLTTCWRTPHEIQSNDFYAIDFLSIQNDVIFLITVAHSPQLQTNLNVEISFDGLFWVSYRSTNGIRRKKTRALDENRHAFLFDSSQFNVGFQAFRYISFKSLENVDNQFQVCEIEILPREKVHDIISDFYN